MIFFQYFFIFFCGLLFLRGLRILIYFFWLKKFLKNQNRKNRKSSTVKRIILFIPLLHEEKNFSVLVKRFGTIVNKFSFVTVVLVTTERERMNCFKNSLDTVEMAKKFKFKNFFHLHYPSLNKTLAPQINFAVRQIWDKISDQKKDVFFGFYNADSHVSPRTINCLLKEVSENSEVSVFQQSSCFTENYSEFSGFFKLLTATNAIRQSSWTFFHEIPRYLKNKINIFSLAHCVTHGLFVRADTFFGLGGFPEDSFGEDLYFGFIVRSMGYKILPLAQLENSKSPTKTSSLFRQKYTWFFGVLGYVFYWYRVIKKFNKTNKINYCLLFSQTFWGILDALGWLISGPCWLVFLLSAYFSSFLVLGFVVMYLYFGLMVFLFFRIYKNLRSRSLFPKINSFDKILVVMAFPMVVLLHSLPAIATIFKEIQLRVTKKDYFRPKTE